MTGRHIPASRRRTLTAQDLDAAPVDSSIAFGVASRLVKLPGGGWRQFDILGEPIGSVLSSGTVASHSFLVYELKPPAQGGAR